MCILIGIVTCPAHLAALRLIKVFPSYPQTGRLSLVILQLVLNPWEDIEINKCVTKRNKQTIIIHIKN